jgi:hypothetical protein
MNFIKILTNLFVVCTFKKRTAKISLSCVFAQTHDKKSRLSWAWKSMRGKPPTGRGPAWPAPGPTRSTPTSISAVRGIRRPEGGGAIWSPYISQPQTLTRTPHTPPPRPPPTAASLLSPSPLFSPRCRPPFGGSWVPSTPSPGLQAPLDPGHSASDAFLFNSPAPGAPSSRSRRSAPALQDPSGAPFFKIRQHPQVFMLRRPPCLQAPVRPGFLLLQNPAAARGPMAGAQVPKIRLPGVLSQDPAASAKSTLSLSPPLISLFCWTGGGGSAWWRWRRRDGGVGAEASRGGGGERLDGGVEA